MDATDLEVTGLLAVLIGSAGAALGLFGLLTRRKDSLRRRLAGLGFAAVLIGSAATVALLGQPIHLWGPLVAVALVFFLSLLPSAALVGISAAVAALQRVPRMQAAFLLGVSPLVGLWWAVQSVPEFEAAKLESPASLVDFDQKQEVAAAHAVTDRGHPVPVYTRTESEEMDMALQENEQRLIHEWTARLLRTAPPDPTHNCHGWVFTGGHYLILGRDVDRILQDNDYRAIEEPRAGDVVIYRSKAGEVLHTGLVRSSDAGTVLVEGKWGSLGRYVHQADDQAYGGDATYYRSPRKGHVLHGIDGTAAPAQPGMSVTARD